MTPWPRVILVQVKESHLLTGHTPRVYAGTGIIYYSVKKITRKDKYETIVKMEVILTCASFLR
jgi:energy-converting hydrogenase Eha subunit G